MDEARHDAIPIERLEQAARAMRVLAHPHRLKLCEILLRQRTSVGDLARALGLKHNVVSQHLNNLRAHGIVAPRREGRSVFYEVIDPSAGWLLECIRKHTPAGPGV